MQVVLKNQFSTQTQVRAEFCSLKSDGHRGWRELETASCCCGGVDSQRARGLQGTTASARAASTAVTARHAGATVVRGWEFCTPGGLAMTVCIMLASQGLPVGNMTVRQRRPHRLDSLPSSTPGAAGRTPRAWFRYLRNTSVRLRVVPRLPPCGPALMPGAAEGAAEGPHTGGTAGVSAAAGRAVPPWRHEGSLES